jgi:hypothetical protein
VTGYSAGLPGSAKWRVPGHVNAFGELCQIRWVQAQHRLLGYDVHIAVELAYPKALVLPHCHGCPVAFCLWAQVQTMIQIDDRRKRSNSKGGLRSRTYATLIALLSVTGLRISEALKLTVADVTRDGLHGSVR